MTTQTQVQARDTGSWDQVYSSYWWKGTYLPGQKREFFKGYSKKYGHNEAKDKDYLLISRVMMLQQHAYIDKCSKIEIHKRIGPICSAQDPIILTLTPETFIMGEIILLNKNLYAQLKNIYEARGGAEGNPYIINRPKVKNISVDKEVQISITKKYISLESVMTEIYRLEAIGIAPGQLQDAYRKIIEKNPRLK